MEYIYAAMLLYKAKKPVDEASITKILEAAGLKPEPARVKALVAALEGVDIEKAIEKAATPIAPQAGAEAPTGAEKKEKPKKSAEEEKKEEAKAAAGLGALFG